MSAGETKMMPCSQADKLNLKSVLCLADSSPRGDSLSLRSRMVLALRVASNLLQLSWTPWLRGRLSKDAIFFLPSEKDGNHRAVDLSSPFISLKFGNHPSNPPKTPRQDPKLAFLELGVLLLEIWHQRSLETYLSVQEVPTEYYALLAVASKWLDDTRDQLLNYYEKAVSHCIRGVMRGETRFLEWDDPKLWSAACQDVIEPLYQNCKQWR